MHILLILLAGLAFILAGIVFETAESAIIQVLAGCGFVASAVLFSAGAICNSITLILRELRAANRHAEESAKESAEHAKATKQALTVIAHDLRWLAKHLESRAAKQSKS